LILAGDDDPIVPLVNARLLNLLIPRSRLQVIKGAGHLLLVTRTDDAVRHINNFLRRRDVRQELPTKETL
jgi:pimeloyl-ACP methyl ester carboxylesterase